LVASESEAGPHQSFTLVLSLPCCQGCIAATSPEAHAVQAAWQAGGCLGMSGLSPVGGRPSSGACAAPTCRALVPRLARCLPVFRSSPPQLTIFKRVCRRLGLQRWPYEKPSRSEGQPRTSQPPAASSDGASSAPGEDSFADAAQVACCRPPPSPWDVPLLFCRAGARGCTPAANRLCLARCYRAAYPSPRRHELPRGLSS
jgi:hypothetical protein